LAILLAYTSREEEVFYSFIYQLPAVSPLRGRGVEVSTLWVNGGNTHPSAETFLPVPKISADRFIAFFLILSPYEPGGSQRDVVYLG
jgi:hypothetical protein